MLDISELLANTTAGAAPKACDPSTLPVTDQKIAFLMVTALCSGMSIITCGFVIVTQGPSWRLTFDRERQRFLAFVSLLAAIFGLFGNGIQLSDHPKSAGDSVASFFFNWLVQLGFAGIAHNSVIRLLTARANIPAQEIITRTSRLCCIFYLLTLPVMTPTFISLIHPNKSGSVKVVARDLNITFVCVVEALATVADVSLLWRFTKNKEHGHKTRAKMIQDMWIVYFFIWLTIGADIFAKVFRNKTDDLVSDLAITNLTLTLRAVAALMYGSTLRNAQEIYTFHSGAYGYSLSKTVGSHGHAGSAIKKPRGDPSHSFIPGVPNPGSQIRMDNIRVTTETHADLGDGELYGQKMKSGSEHEA
ncbi:hypothetical protein CPC08DRAFT_747524 [Agrocybe pediades]|nr:hypothetical protein CPC08DRAFT_747524 [Agrocybe pediades]